MIYKKIKVIGNLILGWVLFLWFSHFSEWIMSPAHPPCHPQFVKLLISIVEKKDLSKNYVEFYFSMGIVHVIFSFFWMVNDLVCVPLPYVECNPFFQCHNYSHTFTHNSKTTRSIFVKFWEIATNNMTDKFFFFFFYRADFLPSRSP